MTITTGMIALWISFGFWWVYFYSSTVGCRDATAVR
jgi:hypothetical protein